MHLKILTWGIMKVIFKILSLSGKLSTLITSYITSQLNISFVVPFWVAPLIPISYFPFIFNRSCVTRQTQEPRSL